MPNFEKIGKSLVGFISKKLHKKAINSNIASYENYKIQLHFLEKYETDLGAYDFDDNYRLAEQKIVGEYQKEKNKLKKYLSDCEATLDMFTKNYCLKI